MGGENSCVWAILREILPCMWKAQGTASLSVFCGQVPWFNPSCQLSPTNPLLTSPSTERNFEMGLRGGGLE